MKVTWLLFLLIFLFQDDPDPLRFKEEIDRFKKTDQIHSLDPGIYLFLGSSSIRMWQTLEQDFPNYPVVNRGFGGSHTSDVLYYFNELVISYQPAKIVFYEGDNDLASGKSPERILEDFKEFHKRVRKELPGTEIGFISAKPSPARWHLKDNYEKFNREIEQYARNKEDITFIDIYRPMIRQYGRPDPSLYISDSLHMSEKGYDIWETEIRPFIEN